MQKNAFAVMMCAQRQLSQKTLPDIIPEPRNSKHLLQNDVITFLSNKECGWQRNEVESSGKSLVTAITDTLWTIDGHHHVFGVQGYFIPTCFSVLVGYNRPELSKHRKREVANMSGRVHKSLSSYLFHCLNGLYWERPSWLLLKPHVEQLAKSLSGYGDYLDMSSKKVKLNQTRTTPVRAISDNLHFSFLPASSATSSLSELASLCSLLEDKANYDYISVEESGVCPKTKRHKYANENTWVSISNCFVDLC